MFSIVVMYDIDDIAAERSSAVSEVVKAINHIYYFEHDLNPEFLPITNNKKKDRRNLQKLYERGHRLFVSALGSNSTKYLGDIFFNSINKRKGVMHVNSFSTAASLAVFPNLLRIFPPDTLNPPVYGKLVAKKDCYIFFEQESVWSSGLANSISQEIVQAVLIPYNADLSDLESQYNQLVKSSSKPTTVIILSEEALIVSAFLNDKTDIEKRLTNFTLLYGDATASGFEKKKTLLFVQRHKGAILQPYIDEHDFKIKHEIQKSISDSPVSSNVSYFMQALSVGGILKGVRVKRRQYRTNYVNIVLNDDLDNSRGLYSLNTFLTLSTFGVGGIAYVAGGKIFISNSEIV